MAKYLAKVQSSLTSEEAFIYMADLRNLEEWDPGVSSAQLADGSKVGASGIYNVVANRAKLVYEITDFETPTKLGFRAKTRFFDSIDFVYFEQNESGCEVTYDATLLLNGPLSILDFALKPFFNKIGDKAAAGLEQHLKGKTN